MTPALWQAIGPLRMNSDDLARFFQVQAAENPFVSGKREAGRRRKERDAGALAGFPEPHSPDCRV